MLLHYLQTVVLTPSIHLSQESSLSTDAPLPQESSPSMDTHLPQESSISTDVHLPQESSPSMDTHLPQGSSPSMDSHLPEEFWTLTCRKNPPSLLMCPCCKDLPLPWTLTCQNNHPRKLNQLILVGDGKTYEHLTVLKRQYGSGLHNVLLFPGDWHILKNYQEVFIKIYFDAGVKEMAKTSGFRGESLTSLSRCSNFKRIRDFLIQAWEELYRQILKVSLSQQTSSDTGFKIEDIVEAPTNEYNRP